MPPFPRSARPRSRCTPTRPAPQSAQTGIHERLADLPIATGAKLSASRSSTTNAPPAVASMATWQAAGQTDRALRPPILDTGCGTGVSSIGLACRYPAHFVIGVDQSADRLATAKGELPANPSLVRAGRLLASARTARRQAGAALSVLSEPVAEDRPCLRRWHGHAVFPRAAHARRSHRVPQQLADLRRGIAFALGRVTGRAGGVEGFVADAPVSPFERKYRDSGQVLYRCVLDLDAAATP